jgi:enoyl-CoA hydratase/carnithine racemase
MELQQDILFSPQHGLGKVLLNRPKALNALTLDMCHALEAALRAWAVDDGIAAVVVKGAGDKAFCAGGDIRRLCDAARAGDDYPYRFWSDEYRLNALIKHYPKPYLALIDGIAMGGGVGLSVHGRYRVASEHALFAMPETSIGFFPDVGGSFFLPRCPGETGLYLGLTGHRLRAADMLYAGIATHFVHRLRLPALERALGETPWEMEGVLARFAEDPGQAPLAANRAEIDDLFGRPTLEAVMDALAAGTTAFARETHELLLRKSPTALALAFHAIRAGGDLDIDGCLSMEWRMASHATRHLPDFQEGVRAVIVDKDNRPRWSPARLADVDPAAIAAFFGPSARGELELY